MRSSTFLKNSADVNGGVYFSDFLSKNCPQFTNTKFIDNSAIESGGALFFDSETEKPPCESVSSFCSSCTFSKNKASLGYGKDYATSPRTLIPITDLPEDLYSSQTFNTTFEVHDGFNQILKGFIGKPFFLFLAPLLFIPPLICFHP
jgi:predicted outer membrane repeat protein